MQVNKFLQGINTKSPRAWKELYNSFYGALCNHVNKIVEDRASAEDIVQGSLISIWESRLEFSGIHVLRAYLYRTVHNNALKWLRDKKTNEERLARWRMSQDVTEDVHFYQTVEEELIRQLRSAIAQLPAQQREIMLQSLDGMTVPEIAQKLQTSINSIKTQKKRAYNSLRYQLKDCVPLLVILEIIVK